jgi:type I restriction enzyme S subunit
LTPKKAELKHDGQRVPWVKAGDLEQEFVLEVKGSIPEIITTNDPHSCRAIRPVNTILLALYGGASTVGKTAILGIPAATNQSVCCISPFEDAFDSYYLFCYLTYMRKSWMSDTQGSRQNIYLQTVRSQSIPRPNLEQQREIAAELRPHNDKICELKRELAVLRQILKG